MEIHEKISAIRHLRGWSQEDMAAKLNMSKNGYAKIERGETDIPLSRLKEVAEILGVKLRDLFDTDEKIFFSSHDHSNQYNYICFLTQQIEIKQELEKALLLLEQKDKEINYLKEIIQLMKLEQP